MEDEMANPESHDYPIRVRIGRSRRNFFGSPAMNNRGNCFGSIALIILGIIFVAYSIFRIMNYSGIGNQIDNIIIASYLIPLGTGIFFISLGIVGLKLS